MPANIFGGLAGAGGGFATGGPIGAALGGLAGLFGGGGQRMSKAQQHALEQQRQIANSLFNYGTSNPLTNQQDLNNLAQSLGIFGAQQRAQLGSLAGMGNIMTPTGGTADMLANLTQAGQANRMAISEQHLADAVAARRQALLNAANVNRGVFDMASTPGAVQPNQLGAQLGAVAQAYAQNQAQKEAEKERKEAAGMGTEFQRIKGQMPPSSGVNPALQAALLAGQAPTGESAADTDQSDFYGPYQGYTPPSGLAFRSGAGDAPQPELPPHDVMKHAMEILHLIIKNHMAAQKPKKKKAKAKGAGDAPALPLPGYGAMAGPPMLQNMPGQNRMQGAASPGNEPGGVNGTANQMRQPASAMLDRLRFGASGIVFPY